MAGPWDEFKDAPAADPWAEFKDAVPQVGLGDVKRAEAGDAEREAIVGKAANVPAALLTGDPATDRRLSAMNWDRGMRRPYNSRDALGSGAVLLGLSASALPGVAPAIAGGGLMSGGLRAANPEATPGQIATSGGLGALFSGALAKYVPEAVNAIGGFARKRLAANAAKQAEQAAKVTAEEQAKLTGSYGGLRQTENKSILNLLAREQSGLLDEANAARLAELKQSGRVGEALNESAANDLDFIATRSPQVRAAKEAMVKGAEELPAKTAALAEEIGGPAEAKRQVMSRVKRYWIPATGAAIGGAIGGPFGVGVGALAGRGASPSVQALGRMLKHPSVQNRLLTPLAQAGQVEQSGLGTLLMNALRNRAPMSFDPLAFAPADEDR